MATISFLTSASSAAVSGSQQFRLQQAVRDADQAQLTARALAAAARDAQQYADQAVQNARAIRGQAAQAQNSADQARQGVAAVKAAGQAHVELVGAVDVVTETLKTVEPATTSAEAAVVNTQGELTGTLVNTTA